MERQSETRHAPPLAYHFVGQAGSKIDESTRSGIRSHAMKEVRNKQRQQKQVEIVQRNQQSVTANDLSLCRCLPAAQFSSASSEQYLERQRDDTSLTRLTPLFSHCYHCNRAQLVGWPPSQWRDDGLQLSSSMTNCAAVEFNPFNSITGLPQSLTSKFSDEINAIKSHAITFCYPGAIEWIVFHEALQSPALLASVLYSTYSYLCSTRGWSSLELALCLKGAAITHINLKLSHLGTVTCTNVIASIAYLITGTWVSGNSFEEVQTHLNGIEMMVKQCGTESLGVSPLGRTISKYIFVQQFLLAAIQAQTPTPTLDLDCSQASNADSIQGIKHESPLYCPQKTFDQLLQSKRLSEDTIDLLYNAKALIDMAIDFDEGIVDEVDFNIALYYFKTRLEPHIATHGSGRTSKGNWIFECCRITVVIILTAIETCQSLMSSDSRLTLDLVKALEKTDIGDNWGDILGVLYWVSMIGSASSHGKPGHRLLDSTLGRTMSKLTAWDFSAALDPVRQFSRLQKALKNRNRVAP